MKPIEIVPALSKLILFLLLASALLPARAAPVTGDLTLVGGALLTGNFDPQQPSPQQPRFAFDLEPRFVVVEPADGVFSSLNGTGGAVTDPNLLAQPLDTPLSFPNFLTFDARPSLSFTLTRLEAGTGTAANCADAASDGPCTFPGSPLTFRNDVFGPNQGSIELRLAGEFADSSTGTVFGAEGVFLFPFTGSYQTRIPQVLAGRTLVTTYAASLTSSSAPHPVAEPGALPLGFVALALLLAMRFRAQRRCYALESRQQGLDASCALRGVRPPRAARSRENAMSSRFLSSSILSTGRRVGLACSTAARARAPAAQLVLRPDR